MPWLGYAGSDPQIMALILMGYRESSAMMIKELTAGTHIHACTG